VDLNRDHIGLWNTEKNSYKGFTRRSTTDETRRPRLISCWAMAVTFAVLNPENDMAMMSLMQLRTLGSGSCCYNGGEIVGVKKR
jgi:hypothetical protein